MTPLIIELTDEYSHLEGLLPDGLVAWGVRPLVVQFEVEPEDLKDDREPTMDQLGELQFQIAHQTDIRESVLRAFIGAYPRLIDFDGGYHDELPKSLDTVEEMASLLDFKYIRITSRSGTGERLLVGFAFESHLDPEHGLGCICDGFFVKNLGGEEEAW